MTQVRVDALVLTPTAGESSGLRRNLRQQQQPAEREGDDEDGDEVGREKEEDRDQSELLVTTRLAVSGSSAPPTGSKDQLHVTAVQVEHNSNAHQDPK